MYIIILFIQYAPRLRLLCDLYTEGYRHKVYKSHSNQPRCINVVQSNYIIKFAVLDMCTYWLHDLTIIPNNYF